MRKLVAMGTKYKLAVSPRWINRFTYVGEICLTIPGLFDIINFA